MNGGLIDSLAGSEIAGQIKRKALSLGFDLAGIAPASPSPRGSAFEAWLAAGRAGTMRYLHDRIDERVDPSHYLPGAKSVICLAANYHVPLSEPPAGEVPLGRVARYALGDDYHELIKDRLYDLADWVRDTFAPARTRCSVDTAPVLEKDLAARAGLGWIGKNTLLISPKLGSYVLLGEVLTTLELPADAVVEDHCGNCRRCLDACPTGALLEPYQLDARRCISYLTIEHRAETPVAHDTGDWLFGCDICQEVCPWNVRSLSTADPALQPRFTSGSLNAEAVAGWTLDEYRQQLRGSAMKRIKLPQLQANARRVVRHFRDRTRRESPAAARDERSH